MKKRLALCLTALVLALLALPRLMAAPPARDLLLSQLGAGLAGEISAESCSFGWLSGPRCRNFRYDAQTLPLTVTGDLRGEKGLLMLLLSPGSLGDIHLDRATLALHAGQAWERAETTGPAAPASASPEPAGQSALVRWWNRNGFRLKAEDARIVLERGGETRPLLEGVSGEALLENGSLRFGASGGGEAAQSLRAEGYLNAPPEGSESARLLGAGSLILDENPLAALPPPALFWPGMPKPLAELWGETEGRLGGSCRFVRDAEGDLRAEGSLTASKLRLPAPTALDLPVELERAGLVFDVRSQSGGRLRLDRLGLESAAASLDLRGYRQPGQAAGGETQFEGGLSLSLPFFAEALRGFLRLHDDARLTAGDLRCDLSARGPAGRLPLRLDCRMDDIAALRGEDILRWQAPLALKLDGRLEGGGFALERAEAGGALAQVEAGQKEDGGFACRAEADLGGLLGEAQRLAALPWESGGKLKASFQREPEGAVRKSEFEGSVDGFFLRENGAELLPRHRLALSGAAVERGGEIRAAELRGEAWPGAFTLDIPALRESDAGMQAEYRLNADLQAARTLPLLRRFWPDSAAARMTRLGGAVRLDLAARLRNGRGALPALLWDARHEIAEAKLEIDRPDFKWQAPGGDCAFSARRASLTTGAAAEHSEAGAAGAPSFVAPAQKTFALAPLTLRADTTELAGDLAFTAGKRPAHALHLRGDLDGAHLETLLRSAGLMPTGARTRGPARLEVSAEASGKAPAETEISARLDRLVFGREKKTLWEQRDFELRALFRATADAASKSWDLPEFSAESPNFWASGKGFLLDQGRAGSMLALDGRYRAGAKAEDKQPAPFQLSVPLQ